MGVLRSPSQTRATVRESAELFRRAFDQSPVPIVLVALKESRLIEANPAAIAAFGFEDRRFIGRPLADLGIWQDPADQLRYRSLLEKSGSVTGFEVTMRTRQGRPIDVLLSGSVVSIAGEPCTLNFLLDLSARKHAAQALAESEDKFRRVFDESPIIVVLLSVPDGKVIEINATGLANFGYTREEMVGRTTVELDIWADLTDRNEYLRRLTTTGSVHNFEARMRRKNGELITLLNNGSLIRIGDKTYSLNSLQDITERKRSDEARETSASLARATLESTADGILATDAAGKIESCNHVFAEMWRLPEEALAECDHSRAFQGVLAQLKDPDAFLQKVRHLYTHPLEESFDTIDFLDGRVFERYSRPMLVKGRPAGRVWSFRDISRRRLDEAAVRASEEKFRGVFDKSPVIMGLLTVPEGRFVEVNEAGVAAFGYSREEALGRTSIELNIWADPADRDRYLQLLKAQGSISAYETQMRRKNGELFTVLYNGSLLRIGDKAYSLNTLQDITGRKRAETKFRDLFAFAPDSILIATQQGVITDANQRAVEFFGYTHAELTGMSAAELMPPEVRPELLRRLGAYLANPVPHAMGTSPPGLIAQSKTGRRFPIDISLSPLHSDEGFLVVAAIRDITAQIRAAEQRQQMEAQLRQAQKMESLGTLAGGIAHDFNNILTGMLGFVELIRQDIPADHPAQKWIGNLSLSGDRAKNLVRQILTFSRKNEGERSPLRLQQVAEEAVRLLRATIPAMIEIETDFPAGCPPVIADSNQMHQILINLCTNSWHAMPAAGGRIRVQVAPCEVAPGAGPVMNLPGTYVRLTVTDNGAGMDQHTLERIFDPFFTTKKTGEGTGLGLAVVHGIVQSHDGFIKVHSSPGQGTSFELYFPALGGPLLTPAARPPLPPPQGGGEHFLLVDDDHAGGTALSQLLERLGYRVTVHRDPHTALAAFQATPATFALVITDLAMPGLTGTQFARQVRTLSPATPVLLISGFVAPEQMRELHALGVSDILRKPPTVDELARAVSSCLARGRAR